MMETTTMEEQRSVVDMTTLHWSALKKLVEDAGGKYEGKAQAVEFLTSANRIPESAPDVTKLQVSVTKPKAGIKLDRSRPFATISGEVEDAPNACAYQDGHYFNSAGDKVG